MGAQISVKPMLHLCYLALISKRRNYGNSMIKIDDESIFTTNISNNIITIIR